MVDKVEAMESGMALPDPSSDAKRAKSAQTAKAKVRPAGSVADAVSTSSSSVGPRPPAEEPPKYLQNKRRHDDMNKTDDKHSDDEGHWMQSKITEAVAQAREANAVGGGGQHGDAANKLGFEPSWQMALQQYHVDSEAQLQLALLRDRDWCAAADIVWKLTKKGSYDDELKNPSGFVNRCCTTAFKNLMW